jgi:prefoldin subunit 5
MQLTKFLEVLDVHRSRIEEQMADLQANLDEIKVHQREARTLLAKVAASAPKSKKPKTQVAHVR